MKANLVSNSYWFILSILVVWASENSQHGIQRAYKEGCSDFSGPGAGEACKDIQYGWERGR